MTPTPSTGPVWGRTDWLFLLVVLGVSLSYETRFIHHWLNVIDEGWPLYAAMQLHHGGVLYRDILFVFPPGHLLAAWIGYGWDPPGVVSARVLYAGFNIALCLCMYVLGRRVMPARWALLGALILALAAPLSHRAQLLFGYRYLVFSVLALLAFSQRLRSGDTRWMFVSGCLVGVAVCFRLTPAFAASVGIGIGVLAAASDWRRWLRDLTWFGCGGLLIALPVIAWFASDVGLATLWREIVVRPVVMTELQSLPVPALTVPTVFDRELIHDAFVALLFRVVAMLYLVYAVVLLARWRRCVIGKQRFDQALLLAIAVWGGIYFLRSLGRADEPHLSSAIPPFCLLAAHALHAGLERLYRLRPRLLRWRLQLSALTASSALALWVFLPGADQPFSAAYRGYTPFAPLHGDIRLNKVDWWHVLEAKIGAIRELAPAGSTILDLSAESLLYVISERMGPGSSDIIMPGTFLDSDEERAFIARLEQDPPSLVIVRAIAFDDMRSRAVGRTAPLLMDWIARRYAVTGDPEDYLMLTPRPVREFGTP